jgi:putative copper export protein
MELTIKQLLTLVCNWLDSTALSQFIQRETWVVPSVQTVHILAIAALMGSMLVVNLRVIGFYERNQPLINITSRFIPVIWAALPILLITGSILIIGEPARSLKNNIFQLKILLILVAIGLTYAFNKPLKDNPEHWEDREGLGQLFGIISCLVWIAIIFAGRWIAYV